MEIFLPLARGRFEMAAGATTAGSAQLILSLPQLFYHEGHEDHKGSDDEAPQPLFQDSILKTAYRTPPFMSFMLFMVSTIRDHSYMIFATLACFVVSSMGPTSHSHLVMSEAVPQGFNYVDILAGLILLVGVIVGYRRGLSGVLARLIGLFVAGYGGWLLYGPAGDWLMEHTRLDQQGSLLTGFVLSFAVLLLAMVFLRWILRNLMEFKFKQPLETVGGVIAGFLQYLVAVVAVIMAATLSPVEYLQQTFGDASQLGRLVTRHLVPAYERVTEELPDLGLPGLPGYEGSEEEPEPINDSSEEADVDAPPPPAL